MDKSVIILASLKYITENAYKTSPFHSWNHTNNNYKSLTVK